MANRTPLYETHGALNARMFEFGGWEMPLWYTSIVDEHMTVRNAVGIFDASHMGKLLVSGRDCLTEFERLVTRKLEKYAPGRCVYAHFLDGDGRIIDDTIVTVISRDQLFVVCNASTRGRVIDWIAMSRPKFELKDITTEYSCLAVQGPKTVELLGAIMDKSREPSPLDMKRYHACLTKLTLPRASHENKNEFSWARGIEMGFDTPGLPALVSRTGYTGEDGIEIFARRDDTVRVWESILDLGKTHGIKPIGLGARDTLRLEMCYLLSGHDFDGSQTPLEADAEFAIDWDHDFVGKSVLEEQKRKGGYRRLVAFASVEKGIPREGYRILSSSGEDIGRVTSGTMSPILKTGIGMGYVPERFSAPGTEISYSVGERSVGAKVVEKPFLKKR
ncbi:MAG: glycine cleavage system aminomethyltransferase GcvT [Thermoplasmata archaeon]